MGKSKTRSIAGLACAVLIVVFSILFTPSGIDTGLWRCIMLICAFMVGLVTNALPMALLSLIGIGVMPLLGITESFATSFGGFSSQAVYFVMMSFGLAAVLTDTTICKRILKLTFGKLGKNIEGLILAIMICAALTSAFISDVPTCVMYMSFGELLLNVYSDEKDRAATGRSVMIGVSVASMIGGISTPVGSTVNILASSILEKETGMHIGFVQWMIVCVPVVAIMIPLSWKLIVKLFKPAPISDKDRNEFISSFSSKSKLDMKEKKAIVIFLIMLVLWFASSWVTDINTMHVMFLGVCVMALPFIGVISMDKIMKSIKFDILLLIGAIITMCNALMAHGLSDFITSHLNIENMNPVLFIAIAVICIYLLILIVPIAPSLTNVVTPVIIILAGSVGISPALMIPVCSIAIGCGYLLPMDSVFLITYSKKYYSIKDYVKISSVIMAAAFVLCPTLAYGLLKLLNI